jgi:type IV secretory pathway VirB4 component
MTRNVDGSVPLLGTSCGSPAGIPFAFADPGRTLELLDPYDRKHANQTMLIVGQSGMGKTMTANILLGRCLAMGGRVFGIDRAGHYGMLTRLVPGGREIDIGADDSPWAINPWDVLDPANVGLQKVTFLKSLHGLMMGADGLTVTERAQLDTAIRQVYAWAANRRLKPRESMLRAALLERAETEREADNPELASMLRHLAERLSEFCDEGSYAYLLDRDTNVPADAPAIVFDTRRCPTELLQLVMFMIVEYVREAAITHRDGAQALTSQAGGPMFAGRSVLVIDEAWHMVSRRETGEYANDLARRARHIGLFLIVISQQMSDFDGEYGRALLRNSTLQLLLAQHPHELPRLKEALDLTDQEAAIIAQLRTVKGQYAQMLWINGERGRAKVSLPVGPLEYWMYTSDPLRDAPAREAAIERHAGDVWAAIHDLATAANGSMQ